MSIGLAISRGNSCGLSAFDQELPDSKDPDTPKTFSTLPQLAQEIQDKLTRGAVECMICYDVVRRSAPVWSCGSCFSIFHLPYKRKWVRSPASTGDASQAGDHASPCWRCPGCQFVYATPAHDLTYTCFCGRRRDPPNDHFLMPHSCSEPCSRPLEKAEPPGAKGEDADTTRCPHVCVLQCHPGLGPCPPCKAFAPDRPCPCGKQIIMRAAVRGPEHAYRLWHTLRTDAALQKASLVLWGVRAHAGEGGKTRLQEKRESCLDAIPNCNKIGARSVSMMENARLAWCALSRSAVVAHQARSAIAVTLCQWKSFAATSLMAARRIVGGIGAIILVLFDPGNGNDFVQGDVIVFPHKKLYRSLDISEAGADPTGWGGAQAPLPCLVDCGTPAPSCLHQCLVPQPCGHPAPPRPRPKPVETWPPTGPIVSEDSLPDLLARSIKSREMTHTIILALFDPGNGNDFVQGDVIVFPHKKLYRYGSL
ncbi:unnamed protein product [Miscanthus lutarioriparius]|uniref:Uncharacterized protein n=1 Tax=Miscanthus lutarioriparius TaxID=422564 RepID=A0A811PB06_9POAL|nr:unnamed protein product [Miscanthus lutarioriparius]